MRPLHSPSHHVHYTIELLTRNPTHCLSPPTSKPSCDRYRQPPKIKPTPLFSPDDALHAHIISWPVKQVSQLGNCWTFHFPKGRPKPWKREVHLFQNFFFFFRIFGDARDMPPPPKSEKEHIWVFSHYHTSMGTKREVQGRWGRSVEVVEVI